MGRWKELIEVLKQLFEYLLVQIISLEPETELCFVLMMIHQFLVGEKRKQIKELVYTEENI